MKCLNSLMLTSAMLAFFSLNAWAQSPEDNPKCEPNPVFNRFAGEVMRSCERAQYTNLTLWRWKASGDSKSGSEAFKVEGEYWYYINKIERGAKGQHPGKLEVVRNFENAVRQGSGEVLSVNDKKVYYRLRKGNDEFWGEAGCGEGDSAGTCYGIMHKIIRVVGMEQSVVVSSEQIAKAMGDEGKVVFYGIYFDTDKATLKTESAPTLAEMAKWLKTNASAKVFIVGHTDMQGPVERNQKLSRDRAASVIAALTKDHGIKADRLGAEGVGPLAPVASNAADAGRAKNRRVEMVLR
ncbi:MAG: OmpA family protein [Sulfurimicrobium sp.]|nr:OmpA family protein [Sulfurimicrobium sp.]